MQRLSNYFDNTAQDFTTVVETNVNVVTRGFVPTITPLAALQVYFDNTAQDFTTVVETNVNVVTRGFVPTITPLAALQVYFDNTAQDTTTQSETNVHLISRGFAPTITPLAALQVYFDNTAQDLTTVVETNVNVVVRGFLPTITPRAALSNYFDNTAQDFTTVVETNVHLITRGFVPTITPLAALSNYFDNTAQDFTTVVETNVHLITRGFAPTITPRAALNNYFDNTAQDASVENETNTNNFGRPSKPQLCLAAIQSYFNNIGSDFVLIQPDTTSTITRGFAATIAPRAALQFWQPASGSTLELDLPFNNIARGFINYKAPIGAIIRLWLYPGTDYPVVSCHSLLGNVAIYAFSAMQTIAAVFADVAIYGLAAAIDTNVIELASVTKIQLTGELDTAPAAVGETDTPELQGDVEVIDTTGEVNKEGLSANVQQTDLDSGAVNPAMTAGCG